MCWRWEDLGLNSQPSEFNQYCNHLTADESPHTIQASIHGRINFKTLGIAVRGGERENARQYEGALEINTLQQ